MHGSGNIRFSELFCDTLEIHGFMFAASYYMDVHKMSEWEFNFWFNLVSLNN